MIELEIKAKDRLEGGIIIKIHPMFENFNITESSTILIPSFKNNNRVEIQYLGFSFKIDLTNIESIDIKEFKYGITKNNEIITLTPSSVFANNEIIEVSQTIDDILIFINFTVKTSTMLRQDADIIYDFIEQKKHILDIYNLIYQNISVILRYGYVKLINRIMSFINPSENLVYYLPYNLKIFSENMISYLTKKFWLIKLCYQEKKEKYENEKMLSIFTQNKIDNLKKQKKYENEKTLSIFTQNKIDNLKKYENEKMLSIFTQNKIDNLKKYENEKMLSIFTQNKIDILDNLEKQKRFVEDISDIYQSISSNDKKSRKSREDKILGTLYLKRRKLISGNFICPLRNKEIIKIYYSDIKVYSSSKYPILIPVKTNKGLEKIIYKKGDDLTKDLFVLETTEYLSKIIGILIEAYNVLIINRNEGFIEKIDGISFSDINSVEELVEYLLNTSGHEYKNKHTLIKSIYDEEIFKIDYVSDMKITNQFIDSFSLFLFVSYLLGIGDRNLSNMILTKNGFFLHIDFSYIFGADPKPFAPKIRIPTCISTYIQKDTHLFKYFLDKLENIFIVVRRSMPKIELFWKILIESNVFNIDIYTLMSFVHKRLMIDKNEAEALESFKKEVMKSMNDSKSVFIDIINRLGNVMRR